MQLVRSKLLELLKTRNVTITFVDVGSRNDCFRTPKRRVLEAYGFEPNPEEYRELVERKTDAGTPSPLSANSFISLMRLVTSAAKQIFI